MEKQALAVREQQWYQTITILEQALLYGQK